MDISATRMAVGKEKVFAIMLMRFNLSPAKATLIIETWFKQHPGENWETLKNLLSNNQFIVYKGVLIPNPVSSPRR
ncbi:MAG: hypothetical protein F6K41_07525 [Symploca sp. SIO3E6]|nr:hypothetical protein [Caldora sp. SIO3E6]